MTRQILHPNAPSLVSPIVFGTAEFGIRLDPREQNQILEIYAEEGGNYIDTAHCYSAWAPGGAATSELSLGRALREVQIPDLFLATKGGHIGYEGYPRPDAFMAPELVRQDLSESLDRLQRDSVDLYYLHRDDPRVPVSELIDLLEDLRKAGSIRHYGASNWSFPRLKEAADYAAKTGAQGFVAVQNQWALARPSWENRDVPGAVRYLTPDEAAQIASLGFTLCPYSTTANGFFATRGERGSGFDSPTSRAQLAAVQQIADRIGATTGEVALAYLRCQPFPVLPIVGTLTESHLREAMAADRVELTPEDLAALELR